MIPAEMDSISTIIIREKGIEAVVDWFEWHEHSFYTMGWFYLGNQQQMEELFYRSIIKVHKELPRYKNNTSFQMWVTSIFIDTCRELSQGRNIQDSEEIESRPDLFRALDQLRDDEKEAMILTYVKGFSQEEAAHIIRVSVDKMKELLFSGIESVRKQLHGSTYNGCKQYHENYIDYLGKTMDRPGKIEFEMHIYNCRECQEDLATFQEVTLMLNHAEWMNDLLVPEHFIENINERLIEKENHRRQKSKKRNRMALAFVSVFAFVIGIGFFTGAFTSVYYAWTEEDEHLSAFLQHDVGQRVNLEEESNGIKIKIKGVVADDFQTLVFYEIENTNEDKQYAMNYEDGLYVENESEIMSQETFPRYYPPDFKAEMNKEGKNVFYGKVGLRPLDEDNGMIKLNISKILELVPNSSDSLGFGHRAMEYKTGKWNFEFPVTKQSSKEYELNELAEIEGIPIKFNKLIIAPTATILDYGIPMGESEKRINFVQFGDLEVNNKKLKADLNGVSFPNSQPDMNWQVIQTHYDPLYGEEPKEVAIQFESAYFSFEDNKSIELDVTKPFPQTFEYAGSTISIDKFDVGQPTTIVISDYEINNREYESFHFNVFGENEEELYSMSMESKGVIVDKNGVEYDPNAGPIDFKKIEQPRHFVTVQTIKLDGNKVIPKRLDIFEYNSMKYLDDVVKISVD